ncbi:MAG: DUF3592 domain-containing protein [Ectothiorhodospiraceae bacterium]|jgi:hypothetical protein
MNNTTLLVISLILALGGLLLAVSGYRAMRVLRASRQWPSVTGEIVHAQVRKRITGPGTAEPSTHPYRAVVVYRYEVDGHTHESDVIELGGRFRQTPRMAVRQVAAYRPGSTVTVYYDPDNPETACLRRSGGGALSRLVGGVIMIAVAVVLTAGA